MNGGEFWLLLGAFGLALTAVAYAASKAADAVKLWQLKRELKAMRGVNPLDRLSLDAIARMERK